jgi:hypothetical protein
MDIEQNFFNPTSGNPDYRALEESSPRTGSFVFTRKRLHQ